MRKKLGLITVIVLAIFLLTACSGGDTTDGNQEETADVVTTASIVEEEQAFEDAISSDGEWIIATLNDLNFEEEIVVDGTFYDGDDPENDIYRKIAAYAQDDDRNITDRYTITAPQMIIKSRNTRFQGGVFEGDIIVEADGFTLYDATVEGSVYFASEQNRVSAEITEDSEVTGEIAVQR